MCCAIIIVKFILQLYCSLKVKLSDLWRRKWPWQSFVIDFHCVQCIRYYWNILWVLLLYSLRYRRSYRQMDRRTAGRKMDRQIGRQTNGQTNDRKGNLQKSGWTDRYGSIGWWCWFKIYILFRLLPPVTHISHSDKIRLHLWLQI